MVKQFYSILLLLTCYSTTAQDGITRLSLQPFDGITMKVESLSTIADKTTDVYSGNGKQVTMCGVVHDARWLKGDGARPVSLTLGGEYVNERVEVRLRIDEAFTLNHDLQKLFVGKNLCVSGTVFDQNEKSELWLDAASATSLIEEAIKTPPVLDTASLQGKHLKLLNNAYVLRGPKWKEPVVTYLKAGSIILAEKSHGGWTHVKVVYQQGATIDTYEEDYAGFINNDALGLDRKGRPLKRRS